MARARSNSRRLAKAESEAFAEARKRQEAGRAIRARAARSLADVRCPPGRGAKKRGR